MTKITPCRSTVSDRFPVASFVVEVPHNRYFEIACATDPRLFKTPFARQRTENNFYSSRSAGLMRAPAGQATFLVPPEQLKRFAGSTRVYYAVATYGNPRGDDARATVNFDALERTPYFILSGDFTGRTLDRSRLGPQFVPSGTYGNKRGNSLSWGGDLVYSSSQELDSSAYEYDDGHDPKLWDSAETRSFCAGNQTLAASGAEDFYQDDDVDESDEDDSMNQSVKALGDSDFYNDTAALDESDDGEPYGGVIRNTRAADIARVDDPPGFEDGPDLYRHCKTLRNEAAITYGGSPDPIHAEAYGSVEQEQSFYGTGEEEEEEDYDTGLEDEEESELDAALEDEEDDDDENEDDDEDDSYSGLYGTSTETDDIDYDFVGANSLSIDDDLDDDEAADEIMVADSYGSDAGDDIDDEEVDEEVSVAAAYDQDDIEDIDEDENDEDTVVASGYYAGADDDIDDEEVDDEASSASLQAGAERFEASQTDDDIDGSTLNYRGAEDDVDEEEDDEEEDVAVGSYAGMDEDAAEDEEDDETAYASSITESDDIDSDEIDEAQDFDIERGFEDDSEDEEWLADDGYTGKSDRNEVPESGSAEYGNAASRPQNLPHVDLSEDFYNIDVSRDETGD